MPSQTLLLLGEGEGEERVFRDRAGKTKLPPETAAALQFHSLARPAPPSLPSLPMPCPMPKGLPCFPGDAASPAWPPLC